MSTATPACRFIDSPSVAGFLEQLSLRIPSRASEQAFLSGGPANGRRLALESDYLPNPLIVPAAFFGGHVDAVYVATGGSHSTNSMSAQHSYTYRLPDGSPDELRDRLDARERAVRRAAGLPITALREDGLLNVWLADGPLAGRFGEVTAAVIDGHGPDELGSSELPTSEGWYSRTGRLEIKDDVIYEIYVHHPLN